MKAMSSWRRLLVVIVGATATAGPATRVVQAQGARPEATPIPRVNGPVPVTPDSRPFLAATHDLPVIDLPRFGYIEEEFLIGGTASVYDWAADGMLRIRTPD